MVFSIKGYPLKKKKERCLSLLLTKPEENIVIIEKRERIEVWVLNLEKSIYCVMKK